MAVNDTSIDSAKTTVKAYSSTAAIQVAVIVFVATAAAVIEAVAIVIVVATAITAIDPTNTTASSDLSTASLLLISADSPFSL